MNHLGTQTIETDRLILRRFVPEDAQAMYTNWASDPAVTKYLTWPSHTAVESSAGIISYWIGHYEKPEFYQWAIINKADKTGEPIGTISVVEPIRDEVRSAEIGYCIGQKWWHQGIMTEALSALIRFFFVEVGVNRVCACHDPRNPHSGEVMKKCGMKYEGTLRQADRNNQGICDVCYYSVLADEWNP